MNITTVQTSNAQGATVVTAKAAGKQRTVKADPARTPEVNAASAVGALFAVLATGEQRAKVLHPSGGQRVTREVISDGGGKMRWTLNV